MNNLNDLETFLRSCATSCRSAAEKHQPDSKDWAFQLGKAAAYDSAADHLRDTLKNARVAIEHS